MAKSTSEHKAEAAAKNSDNQERLRRLYIYLLSKTDLGLDPSTPARLARLVQGDTKPEVDEIQGDEQGKVQPNEMLVAYQWGCDRIFVRRMLRFALPQYYPQKDERTFAPGIELSRLVTILNSLDRYKSDKREKYLPKTGRRKAKKNILQSRLTSQEKLKAIRLYNELSKEERKLLSLENTIKERLLIQLVERLQDSTTNISESKVKELYKFTFEIRRTNVESGVSDTTTEKEKIAALVEDILKEKYYFLPYSNDSEFLKETIEKISGRVEQELARIRFQLGGEQKRRFLDYTDPDQLSWDIIEQLTQSMVNSQAIERDSSINIKYIEVERIRPLPLRTFQEQSNSSDGLLDPSLIAQDADRDNNIIEIKALAQQICYRARIYFQIAIEGEKKPIDFYEEATGVSSPISLVVSMIDKILLSGIPCLKEHNIFPTARNILYKSSAVNDNYNSLAWTHSVVQLCNEKTIREIVKTSDKHIDTGNYDLLDFSSEFAVGDFCAFDILESITKSALRARLNAISALENIDLQRYFRELETKINETKAFRLAKEKLKGYPFSVWAMRGILQEGLFKYYDYAYNTISDTPKKNTWSSVMYDGILILAEVFLIEGKQEAAKLQLNEIEKRSDGLSNLQHAKHQYLAAYYHFLYDLQNKNLHQDRHKAVRAAEESLARAEKHLKIHIQSYQVIDCISQTNIHPFFEIVGKIYLLKARLNLGFSSYLRSSKEQYSDNLKQVLVYLQQARIAAARDGNPDDYAYYSSFQSWIYSMLSCSDEFLNKLSLTSKSCQDWSKRLLEHAKLCYSKTGEASYNSIKLNAGQSSNVAYECGEFNIRNEAFEIEIEPMKFIQEHEGIRDVENEKQIKDSKVQDIFCMSELTTKTDYESPNRIYLFGTQSALILLSEGIQKLSKITLDHNGDTEEEKTDRDQNAKSAMRSFMAAWAIAEDGIIPDEANNPEEF
jgi:hypothetical protein